MHQRRLDDPDEPLFPVDLEREREWLSNLERAWQDGSLLALRVAISSCEKNHRPLPKWVNAAALAVLAMSEKKRRGRLANMAVRDKQTEIHYLRHSLVRQLKPAWASKTVRKLKPEMTWEDAREQASKILRGTPAQGSPDAMKKSYELVEKLMKQGRGWRFYLAG
jgi:hypothetical protein